MRYSGKLCEMFFNEKAGCARAAVRASTIARRSRFREVHLDTGERNSLHRSHLLMGFSNSRYPRIDLTG